MSQTSDTGRPGRYDRTFGGLVGSMIVLVLVVFAIVVFRGAFRDTPEYRPDDIDHVALVTSIQQLGYEPVYPSELPDGWSVKAASFDRGDRPAFDLVFTTDDERTAGIHQEDTSERDLLDTYVGTGVDETGETLTTDLAEWTGWEDTDSDHAWTAKIGDDTVLAYSSGDPDALTAFVESLTTAPLEP